MNGYSILMFIFSAVMMLFGILVYNGHDKLLARGYYQKRNKAYLRYLGKTIMIIALAPLLSGIVALFGDIDEMIIPIFLVLIGSMILGFIISIKVLKR